MQEAKEMFVLKCKTGQTRHSRQHSSSASVHILTPELYAEFTQTPLHNRYKVLKKAPYIHEELKEKEIERVWEDTRSRSGLHGGLYRISTFNVPRGTIVGWSFVDWRRGYPFEKEEGACAVEELISKSPIKFGDFYLTATDQMKEVAPQS